MASPSQCELLKRARRRRTFCVCVCPQQRWWQQWKRGLEAWQWQQSPRQQRSGHGEPACTCRLCQRMHITTLLNSPMAMRRAAGPKSTTHWKRGVFSSCPAHRATWVGGGEGAPRSGDFFPFSRCVRKNLGQREPQTHLTWKPICWAGGAVRCVCRRRCVRRSAFVVVR